MVVIQSRTEAEMAWHPLRFFRREKCPARKDGAIDIGAFKVYSTVSSEIWIQLNIAADLGFSQIERISCGVSLEIVAFWCA